MLDLGLPDMDGYQLAERLRGLPGCRQLPCLALSGYGQDADKARSRAANVIGHLVKPVEAKQLRQLLIRLDGSAPGELGRHGVGSGMLAGPEGIEPP